MTHIEELMRRYREEAHTPTYADPLSLRQELEDARTEATALRATEQNLREQLAAQSDRIKHLHATASSNYGRGVKDGEQLAARVPDEPMFWVRLCSDGMYEGPIHHKQIERVRQQSGAWSPLYLGSQPVAQPEQPAVQGEPVAWIRKWAYDGEEPKKEKNASGRLAWPWKYKLLPVTLKACLPDDFPLYTHPQPERVALPDEQMREKFEELLEGSLFKRRADNPNEYWDGNVQDDWNLFLDAVRYAEAAHGIKGAQQ